jgi:BA14K-like protein
MLKDWSADAGSSQSHGDASGLSNANWRRQMLKKLGRIAIAAALGVATLAYHIESSSAQTPRPTRSKAFEQGQGRNLPYYVSRNGGQNEGHPYYHRGWWYNVPWWQDNFADNGSTAALDGYDGTGPIADPYPTRRYRYYRSGSGYNSTAGLLAAPITVPLAVASAPFRALSGESYYGRGRHADWCSARYRSYNPSTDTWVSYSGAVHQCMGPYR